VNSILSYNADPEKFFVFRLLRHLLDGMPCVFTLIQGSSSFTPQLPDKRAPTTIPSVSAASRSMLTSLHRLTQPSVAEDFVRAARDDAEAQAALVKQRSLDSEELDEADVPVYDKQVKKTLDDACAKGKKILMRAAAAMRDCAGAEKLEETIAALECKERFNLNVAPPALPDADSGAEGMFDFLGVDAVRRTPALAMRLRTQWDAHRSANRAPRGAPATADSAAAAAAAVAAAAPAAIPSAVPPRAVLRYWQATAAVSPDLSTLAIQHWLRPVSSCSVERVFSLLTLSDAPNRRSMGRDTLYDTLFLRGNQRIVDMLVQEEVDRQSQSLSRAGSARPAEASKRRRVAVEAATAAVAAAVAPAPTAASGPLDDGEAELSL